MGGETVFFVRDNGIGIDPQFHSKVFGIFEKLDPKSPGAGLGLSMVMRIVEKFGGRIWVESEGIDKGACFFFTLPHALVQG
jgi:signal transduction histidine kinase